MKTEPEEIPGAEHELVIDRVAAIDAAKASGKVCVRIGGRGGRRVSRVWDVAATSGAVAELADYLVGERIEKVTVESTSDWRIWFYLLEAAGLAVQLVNARDVKNVPGARKTTNWTRSGWPSSPKRACCDRVSCRRRRSASCVTTPGCGSI